MKKPFAAAILAALMLLSLTACDMVNDMVAGVIDNVTGSAATTAASTTAPSASATTADEDDSTSDIEREAMQLEDAATYENTFLGVSFTVPAGWWQYHRNAENFNDKPATTADTSTLDIRMDEGYRQISLGKFASLQDSTKSNHLGVAFYAERIDGLDTLDLYVEDYEDYMLEPVDGYEDYILLDSFSEELLGRTFECRQFEIPQDGGAYNVLALMAEIENGYFLVIEADFWPENSAAVRNVLTLLEGGLGLE